MQPDPWGDVEPEHKSTEPSLEGTVSLADNNFNGQIIMLQPPSSSSKVIGILLIIWGSINAIFLLLGILGWTSQEIREEQGISSLEIILNIVSGLIAILTSIIGGIWMTNYQRRGIHLVLVGIFIGFIFSVILSMSGSTSAAAQDAGLNEDAVSILMIGVSVVCNAVCGLIVAIPLMVGNNGLDDSKLF
jgi:hypothetical protein